MPPPPSAPPPPDPAPAPAPPGRMHGPAASKPPERFFTDPTESKGLSDAMSDFAGQHPLATALDLAATALCTYHGWKRNESVGWAFAWGVFGGAFPIIAPVIAVAQGFAEPARVKAQLAAIGTNEHTAGLAPHLRVLCLREGAGGNLAAALEQAGFHCEVRRREGPGFAEEVGECVRASKPE